METTVTRAQLLPLLSDQELELILLPTEQCNFRCTYCYEDFSIGRMKRGTIDGVKNLIERRAGDVKRLQLSWFGGEPLVAKRVVFEISEHTLQLARERETLSYKGSMTTNGYLLDDAVCERLVALGVTHYQISLDGWGEVHDISRRRADHAGTFPVIWSNLLSMRRSRHGLTVTVRVHLQPHNVESVTELTTELIREFAADSRFDVMFKPVGNWGGPNSAEIDILSEADGVRITSELAERWQNARPRTGAEQADVQPAAPEAPYVCYASRPNSLMIRANGKVGKCTVMLTDPRNEIGELRSDGTIALHQGRLGPWLRGFQSMDELELGCPAVNFPGEGQNLLQIQ